MLSLRFRGAAALATILLATSTLSACGSGSDSVSGVGSGPGVGSGSGSGGAASSPAAGVPSELTSSTTTPWKVVSYDGARYAVGHGVEFTIPGDWVDYGAEKTSTLGDTYEWAVGMPASSTDPADVEISMGIPGKGAPYDDLTHSAVAEAQLAAPGHKLISQGTTTVTGAARAFDFRFDRTATFHGKNLKIEQLTLLIDMGDGVAATLRFACVPGAWHRQFDAVYRSVTVAPKAGASA